ncbi:MAG: NAD(P)H-dependent oxidoreductase [Syntrophales bacterium]|jgi:multimeric flavodoxin WrbA|nr:NAD(P)H-dependent oxidoreductase [Syntrophales bacterium]MDY0045067.1 NAD(P)H-dependent oxidoreductase [Syntrophales bacterium]
MKKILILYSSQTGNTEQMARAVYRGASSIEDIEAVLKIASEAMIDDLLGCQGLAIGTPENFGYMSGLIKDFFDRTYIHARGKVLRMPYAVFVSAGNDGSGAVHSIERIALGYQFKKVYNPLICKGMVTEEIILQCEELGKTLAAGVAFGIY